MIGVVAAAHEWTVKKMRLIDAEKLVEKLKDWRGDKEDVDMHDPHDVGYYAAMSRAISFAALAHTVDAVPVIRCKDCNNSQPINDADYVWCATWREEMYRNGFCHEGVKRLCI